ncbi:MAG: transmembrane 220 family protein [Gammaproteobacteria bacterium]|nr:transmembrane 220 family protein [Gammaproteobacteria bacterium]
MTLDLRQNTACYIMVPVFVLCIVVQYNDPDGWLWMTIYGVGLVLTLLHLFSKSSFVALSTASAVGFAGFIYIIMTVGEVQADKVLSSMNMAGRGVEEVREALGLLIQSAWLARLAWVTRSQRRN